MRLLVLGCRLLALFQGTGVEEAAVVLGVVAVVVVATMEGVMEVVVAAMSQGAVAGPCPLVLPMRVSSGKHSKPHLALQNSKEI